MPLPRVALLSVALLPVLAAQSYSFQQFSIPGALATAATAINNRGEVVGSYTFPLSPRASFKRDANGKLEFPIIAPDADRDTEAFGISNSGEIVGSFRRRSEPIRGFLLTGGPQGTFHIIDVPPGPSTWIYGINGRGDITGNSGGQAFVRRDGVVTRFTVPGALPGTTRPAEIGWDGTVVGTYQQAGLNYGFLRGPKGNLLRFRVANTLWTFASGINNEAGKIVGWYHDFRVGNNRGFVFNYLPLLAALREADTPAVRDVYVHTINYPGAHRTVVTGINAKGMIVGWAEIPFVPTFSFIGTPVP